MGRWKRDILATITIILAMATAAQGAVLRTINFPGADSTTGLGISDNGNVVGQWSDSVTEGGYFDNTSTIVDVTLPIIGADVITASDVTDNGIIVGLYRIGSTHFGYATDPTFATATTYAYPGADVTDVLGVNDAGHVVGQWSMGVVLGGFYYDGSTYHNITFPGVIHASDINNLGQIVGTYEDNGERFGYVTDTTLAGFTTIGSAGTDLLGINDMGDLVGQANSNHFAIIGGKRGRIDSPGLLSIDKINASLEIVGYRSLSPITAVVLDSAFIPEPSTGVLFLIALLFVPWRRHGLI